MIRLSLTSCLLACLTLSVGIPKVLAQEQESVSLPEYIIELDRGGGCNFAPLKRSVNHGVLQLVIATLPGPRIDREGKPAVSMITVSARMEGEGWLVGVHFGRGEFYDAGDEQVAAFKINTNERVEVREAVRFGVSPFRIGVVKVLGQTGRAPHVSNKTQSVSVEKLEANALPEPYRLFIKNNSDQNVLAVQYNTYKGGRFMHLKWLAGERSRPLIKSGDVYRVNVLIEDQTCAGPDGYRPVQTNRIEIASVVFADGSYEGDAGLAVLIRGDALGNKKHLYRIVEMLKAWGEREVLTSAEVAAQLRDQVAAMDETAEPYMLNNLQSNFPSLGEDSFPALSNFIRHGQHVLRNNVLDDVVKLEAAVSKGEEAGAVRAWLAQTGKKYARWLEAAEAATAGQ